MAPATDRALPPRLLLHTCCGPCATVVVERLLLEYEVTMLWYNPNLQPPSEYRRRQEAARQVAEHFHVEMVEVAPDHRDWVKWVSQAPGWRSQPEGGERCKLCCALRITRTAQEAARRGFDYCDTTLRLSPHKDVDLLRRILHAACADNPPVKAPALDYRKRGGFQRSVKLSRDLGLYRQDYCGCLVGRKLQAEGRSPRLTGSGPSGRISVVRDTGA